MTSESHIIVWTAGTSVKLAVCVAAALLFGGCTSNGEGFSPVDPGGTRPAALQYSILGSVFARTPTGEIPVEGAVVEISRGSGSVSATTDADGRYILENVTVGRWTLAVQKAGYRAVTAQVDLTDTTSLDFVLPAEDADAESTSEENPLARR
jgi:hypothetical protein